MAAPEDGGREFVSSRDVDGEGVVQPGEGVAAIDDSTVDRALRYLLAPELALLGDTDILAEHTENQNRMLIEQVSACMDEASVTPEVQRVLLPSVYVTSETVEGNPLSRAYVERFGFGISRSPQFESVASERVDADPPAGATPPANDHEAQRILAECESAAQTKLAEVAQALSSSELIVYISSEATSALEPFFASRHREWRACMGERGYEVADVDELIAGLDLESLSSGDAWRVERDAALADHDCHGGEDGLRAALQERVDATTAVVRGLSAAEQAELVDLLDLR